MKILVVEDDLPSFEILHWAFKKMEIPLEELAHAETLKAASDMLKMGKVYNAIFFDLHLPDATEESSLAFIKAHPEQKIIIFSGTDDESIILESMRSGAVHFLSKSHFRVDDLKRALLYVKL